jgi:HEAT repeat protein
MMLRPEDIKAQKHFLLGALVVGLLLFGINSLTGFFTRMHLQNEEVMAIKHGADSDLYRQMVKELIHDLQSEIDWKRQLAAVELGHLGAGADRALPELEQTLQDKRSNVRQAAALALARLGRYSGAMVAPLLELLQGGNVHEQYLAARALGRIGRDAEPAVPALQEAMQSGQDEFKEAVADALKRIGGP